MNFSDVYKITIEHFNDDTLLTWFEKSEKFSITGNEYAKRIDAIAAALEQRLAGVEKGRWIGLKSNNHYLWFAAFFALLKIGYPVLLLDPAANDTATAAFAQQARMKAIITDRPEKIEGILNITMSEFEVLKSGLPQGICWEDRIAFCTSGTTGQAKIYVFYTDAIYAQCKNVSEYLLHDEKIVATRNEGGPQNNPSLLTLPLRHCLGFGIVLSFWTAGFPLVLPEKPGIFGIIDTCRNQGIWFFCSVPAIWKGLIRIAQARFGNSGPEEMKKLLGKNFRFGASAGAKLDSASAEKLLNTGIYVVNGWGMTETSFVTMGAIENDSSLDYVGVLYNKHSAVIVSPEDGTVSDEGYGELAVNGRSMHTATLLDGVEVPRNPEEYFRTGDIFELYNGRLYFKGRCKSVIINDSGENIYPEELDTHFSFLENSVEQFCTAGYEEEPALFISSKEAESFNNSTAFDEILQKNSQLPLGKRITKIFVFNQQMPVTSKGEIARFFLGEFLEKHPKNVWKFSAKKS